MPAPQSWALDPTLRWSNYDICIEDSFAHVGEIKKAIQECGYVHPAVSVRMRVRVFTIYLCRVYALVYNIILHRAAIRTAASLRRRFVFRRHCVRDTNCLRIYRYPTARVIRTKLRTYCARGTHRYILCIIHRQRTDQYTMCIVCSVYIYMIYITDNAIRALIITSRPFGRSDFSFRFLLLTRPLSIHYACAFCTGLLLLRIIRIIGVFRVSRGSGIHAGTEIRCKAPYTLSGEPRTYTLR